MTTTEPTATKYWHAQSAAQVCADPGPGGTRSGGAMTAAFQKVALLLAIALAMTPWQEPSA